MVVKNVKGSRETKEVESCKGAIGDLLGSRQT
jgi:hypothetical protein